MSAALLREAATALREHAEKATPGQWRMLDGFQHVDGDGSQCVRIAGDEYETVLEVAGGGWLEGRTANFELIARMGPPVALALADLLESDATYYDHAYDDSADLSDMDEHTKGALATARAILRRSE